MKFFAKNTFAYLAAVFFTATCFAFGSWGSHKSSASRATDITFENNMKFSDGVSLPAGTYRVSVPNNAQAASITFSQDGKVVATEKAKVVDEQKKNDTTEIDSTTQGNAQELTAIRPSGWQEEIVFGNPGQ
jgi:hypothetical protein